MATHQEHMNYLLDFLQVAKQQMQLHLHALLLVYQGLKMYGQIQEGIQEQQLFSRAGYGLEAVNQNVKVFLHLGLDHFLIFLQKKVMMMKVFL